MAEKAVYLLVYTNLRMIDDYRPKRQVEVKVKVENQLGRRVT